MFGKQLHVPYWPWANRFGLHVYCHSSKGHKTSVKYVHATQSLYTCLVNISSQNEQAQVLFCHECLFAGLLAFAGSEIKKP